MIVLFTILKSITWCISVLLPKFTILNRKYGVEIRSKFLIHYKNCINSKRKNNGLNNATTTTTTTTPNVGKNVVVYENRADSEICEFEQKLIEVDVEDKFVLLEKAQANKNLLM